MCDISSIFVTLNISNAIGFISFGVHMRKLSQFRVQDEILSAVVPPFRAVLPLALGWEASAAVPLPVPPRFIFGRNVRYWQRHCQR